MFEKPVICLLAGNEITAKEFLVSHMQKKIAQKEVEVYQKNFSEMAENVALNHCSWNGKFDQPGKLLLDRITQAFCEYDPACSADYLIEQNLDDEMPEEAIIFVKDWNFCGESDRIAADQTIKLVKLVLVDEKGFNFTKPGNNLPENAAYYDRVIQISELRKNGEKVAEKIVKNLLLN